MADKLILVKSSRGAGLGDSLRVVLAAIAYSQISGRGIAVDWSDGSLGPEGVNVFPSFFQLHTGLVCPDLPSIFLETASVHPPIWQHRLHEPVHRLYLEQGWTHFERERTKALFSADLTQPFYSQDVIVLTDFTGLPQHLIPEVLPHPLRQCLLPAASVAVEVNNFVEQHFTKRTIGVHLRETQESGARLKARSDESVWKALQPLLDRWPGARVFLATDNQATQERFGAVLPDMIVQEKAMPPAGMPMHLTDYGPSLAEKTNIAVVDILLLARCDALIYPSNSSFSIIASLLSCAPSEHLFALPPDLPPLAVRLLKRVRSALGAVP